MDSAAGGCGALRCNAWRPALASEWRRSATHPGAHCTPWRNGVQGSVTFSLPVLLACRQAGKDGKKCDRGVQKMPRAGHRGQREGWRRRY